MIPNFIVLPSDRTEGCIIKAWNRGVQFEDKAIYQLENVASLPFVRPWVAAMADCHWGMGCTVGSVVPTKGAVIPAAVGVDIGCGMMAVRITDADLSDLAHVRKEIERVVPHGRTNNGGAGDRGAWHDIPDSYARVWETEFENEYARLCEKHSGARSQNAERHLGTLGTGNHFIEVCLDETERVWIVLHSGSRGLGNRIGTYFTQLAKKLCADFFITLPDPDLAYLPQDSDEYADYLNALHLAQRFAWTNRELMMNAIIHVLGGREHEERIHCHHNYLSEEEHFGQKLLITRKGAVDASLDKMVIIPGSMGARTYIARGLGSPHSFRSCSHGAGRAMGRKAAEKAITPEQHMAALAGIECHNGPETIDESPAAYKPIEDVMAAQTDLVEAVHTLRQIVNVKGWEK